MVPSPLDRIYIEALPDDAKKENGDGGREDYGIPGYRKAIRL